ncbi:MAG: NosD domain-containing protein, partial [Candidatus Thorarchaeota archaeon]
MSKRVVATLLLALILILSATAPASENIESISLRIHKSRDYTPSQYQPHSPIEISRNSDFDTLGFAGNGSIENPYIIANFSISSSTATSISIRDTTAYFIIYNCLVEAGSNGVAIQFNEVQNGRIESCEIGGGNTGIVLIESSFCTVSNTMIYYCSTGIHLYSTNNSTIIFSRLFNNYRSVRIDESLFCNIVNSSIYANTREAIDLGNFAFNNSIYGNSIGWNGDSGNVIDLGHHNHFDDGVGLGNAWDDFNGSIPFVIPGTNGSIDSYPQLLVDNVNPVIYGLADIAFDIETTGNSMTWMVSDDFPNTYSIQI